MENLRVRRAGYCNRQPYEAFVTRYKVCSLLTACLFARLILIFIGWRVLQMLTKETWPVYRGDQKQGARFIIDALNLSGEVAFGTTKLFIKEPKTLVQLEAARDTRLGFVVAKIQAGYVANSRF